MSFKTVTTLALIVSVCALATIVLFAAPPPAPAPPPPPGHGFRFFSSGGPRLGVTVSDVDADRARALKLKEEAGAEVKTVLPESPAAAAGIKAGDVVVEYQGSRVEGAAQLTRLVRETPVGRTVSVKVARDGTTRVVSVTLVRAEGEGRHHVFEKRIIEIPDIEIPDIEIPDIPMLDGIPQSMRLGVSIESLTEQLAGYFGVKGGGGVLVRSVQEDSRAAEAGLKAGDVIVKVDDEAVEDASSFRAALRDRRGKGMILTVVRDRREQTFTVKPAKREDPGEREAGDSPHGPHAAPIAVRGGSPARGAAL